MELKVIIVALLFCWSLSTVSTTNTCNVRDREDCIYTVVCEGYPGTAYTPECSSEIHVTFIIKNSELTTLTPGFFSTTNFDNRVRVFKGESNSWTNIETLAFRYYTRTLEMDISNNKIVNIKDDAFKSLFSLTMLNISNNAIQKLNPKSLHIGDSKTPDLSCIDLSDNMLTDLSDKYFANLQNLRQLYLQNNKIMTLSDSTFYGLNNLAVLNLNNNKITALNSSLSLHLKSLKDLYVSFNQLTHLYSYEIHTLTALEVVNMSHNFIETIESNCFNQAFNLMEVDFKNNKIKSNIDSLMFINNIKLHNLDLSENNIIQIQDNAFQHNVLKIIKLDKNNLTGEITSSTFNGLKSITTLNLSNQSLTTIKMGAFSDTVGLVYLNISYNNIQLIENSSFTMANALNTLDVSWNNVSDINFLRNSLGSLTEIYLQGNNLVNISKNSFSHQTLLTKLDLSYNKIESIEQHSLSLHNLQYLNLNGNYLFGVVDSDVFSPAQFLRFLDLSNFKLNKVNEMALIDLPVLARLNISHNELEYIDPNNFVGMGNIYNLDLSYNKLSCFYLENSSLINLKAFYLNNNNLSNISRTLINMTGLLYADLSNNNISDLSDVPFTSLQNLKVLHLSHNNIRVFNNPQTNSLIKLTDLNLAGNRLTDVNLSHFSDLVSADISYNKISFFNLSFFVNLESLQWINLSGNLINQINPGTFQKLKILKFLNLSHNMVSVLRYGSFRGLNRTEMLDISYNDLSNIDVDIFHECNELRRLTIDYNKLKTFDVERLVATLPKLTTLSIGGNPLSCKEIVRNIKSVNRNLIRQVDVTSIDKLYHEDNVHGIQCGDTNAITTTMAPAAQSTVVDSTSFVLIVWCSLLTVIVLVSGIGLYTYKKKTSFYESDYRLQFRNTPSRLSNTTNESLLG